VSAAIQAGMTALLQILKQFFKFCKKNSKLNENTQRKYAESNSWGGGPLKRRIFQRMINKS